jgi:transposase
MAKKYIVELSDEEREQLSRMISSGRAAASKLTRARVLLKADASPKGPGWSDSQIADAFDVVVQTVENIRERCVLQGVTAALERKKQTSPRRKKVLDGEKEAKLVALCCSTPPEGHARWTLRLLADRLVELEIVETVCHETVRQCLKKTN